ncbi:hypothetical protein TREPR_1032 [Treponema primitia ZAS-2]|uniref:TonB-dependent receptor plug domain-containing protein n=1 Tax=Treponema primitia (strain ATCC BAA-887 / DSM 12427 / ZAS-2) TaxID=545694 RepID=F5YHP4_TREPZ|nr:TonB-dependent receptor plug domain-containing protein [Treponema primitia]AEF84547.1 hypothetical protein TREPR_1032 [Treponema primitia ZAS-2]
MRSVRTAYFILLCFFCLGPLFARDVEITVSDADLEIPLEGAVIRSWDGDEYYCDEEGRVSIPVPDDRPVVIRIAYPGYENGRLMIPVTGERFSGTLRLGGVMENRELVIEASPPEENEIRSGRSITIAGDALNRTSEIGFIEDVMTSIKLLPGVGYSGMFNAQPSIRGGDPGDLMAAMDGFYIEEPYHWGGAYSIFVPQMVESARLSHGIFSARYGHTISGLLEIVSRKPSHTETQLDLGVSTSETNLGLSFPLGGRGGISASGKVTYWDPFVLGAQQLSKGVPEIEVINSITTAPYIRDFSLNGDYRFSTDMDLNFTGFFGGDGVGAEYQNTFTRDERHRDVDLDFDWMNYTAFAITGFTWSPRSDMLFRASAGIGFYESDLIAKINMNQEPGPPTVSDPGDGDPDEGDPAEGDLEGEGDTEDGEDTEGSGDDMSDIDIESRIRNVKTDIHSISTTINYQGRVDFDWEPAEGFLFAAGLQELYAQWIKTENIDSHIQFEEPGPYYSPDFWRGPGNRKLEVLNQGFSSSVYSLLEYRNPSQKYGAELGLRLDHFYFVGADFTLQTLPVFNPRLNLDYSVFKNRGIIDDLSVTTGTGLFSSMNDAITSIALSNNIDDFELKPNRSWTSLLGLKIDFIRGFSFNIEGYFKHVFDRAYTVTNVYSNSSNNSSNDDDDDDDDDDDEGESENVLYREISVTDYRFNGTGRIIGFDFILQKTESRYWDGWLSYSFTWAQYRDPNAAPDFPPTLDSDGVTMFADRSRYAKTGNGWYYPSFHRYHNINLILNLKPSKAFNIGLRFGFATGRPDDDDNDEREGFSWPVDVKFSFFRFNPKGKVNTEIYLGIENLQALVYDVIWISRVNGYTGEEEPSEYTPVYDLPIPMVSFGFKWRY